MASKFLDVLRKRIASGALQADGAQMAAAGELDRLAVALASWRPSRGLVGRLFAGKSPAPRGLYIHGKVGRGKTMLMDLFYETTTFAPKRRLHFHEFMAEVHDRIGAARKTNDGDPIAVVADDLAAQARLLCFDEFHVTDIADAMILGRLFQAMFASDVVIVATSNVAPDGLYRQGLNRQLFLPFIALIEQRMQVVELRAQKDFRLEKLSGQPLYFTPADAHAMQALRAAFKRLTGLETAGPRDLDVKGRKVRIAEAAEGVAFVSFADLCERPLGALDYLSLAEGFHTVIVSGVPRLTPERRAEARRFITLIDTLYDAQTGLILSADAEPDDLYPLGDEAFLFERTASRLIEMRSAAYLEARRGAAGMVPAASFRN